MLANTLQGQPIGKHVPDSRSELTFFVGLLLWLAPVAWVSQVFALEGDGSEGAGADPAGSIGRPE